MVLRQGIFVLFYSQKVAGTFWEMKYYLLSRSSIFIARVGLAN